jgi:hypothetical protein
VTLPLGLSAPREGFGGTRSGVFVRRAFVAGVLATGTVGCAGRVDLRASVPGAVAVEARTGVVYSLPDEIRTSLPVIRRHRVEVSAAGHETVTVDVGRGVSWSSGFPPSFLVGRTVEVEVVMIPVNR